MPMRPQRRRDIIGRIETISQDYERLKTLVSLARCELGWSEQDYQPKALSSQDRRRAPRTAAASAVAMEAV